MTHTRFKLVPGGSWDHAMCRSLSTGSLFAFSQKQPFWQCDFPFAASGVQVMCIMFILAHEWGQAGRTQSLPALLFHLGPLTYIYIPSPLCLLFRPHSLSPASSSSLVLLQASHARTRAVTRMPDRSNVFAASLPGRTPPASIASHHPPLPICPSYPWGSSSSPPPPKQYRRADIALRQSWPSKRQERRNSYLGHI